VLSRAGFTGTVGAPIEQRLGRPIDPRLANLGRLLWFDTSGGLHNDNTCGGGHSPANGFGDSQSIAIGAQNNNWIGPHRAGPRNQRRTSSAANAPLYPKVMWNGRFSAPSGDPFDNSLGYLFPAPEGSTKFPPFGPVVEADQQLGDVMSTRGYPVSEFAQRAADISVDHPLVLEHYRTAHDIAIRQTKGEASTEDLRQAMIHYRSLFEELVGEPETPPMRVAS